jgi:class 3 adenylate cyclase
MTRAEAVEWALEWMHLSAAPGDAVALTRMFYESDVRDVLGTIRVPTLVLSRRGAMEDEARAFAGLIAGARLQTMPGTQRAMMQEHTDAYADAIVVFAHELRDEEEQLDSVLATVLFTDIVGSTARQAALGDRRWAELVQGTTPSCARASPATGAASSTPPATASLPRSTARHAGSAARAIVDGVAPLEIEVRAGLHTGECRVVDDKIGGLAVSIGARVSALAAPSEVLVSQTVRDLVAGSGLVLAESGEHELKGGPGVWRVGSPRRRAGSSPRAAPATHPRPSRPTRPRRRARAP